MELKETADMVGSGTESRTPVSALRGQCPGPLDDTATSTSLPFVSGGTIPGSVPLDPCTCLSSKHAHDKNGCLAGDSRKGTKCGCTATPDAIYAYKLSHPKAYNPPAKPYRYGYSTGRRS